MYRTALASILALIVLFTWPMSALAVDPDTCLNNGKCYASNKPLTGTYSATSPDGTNMGPWIATTEQEILDVRQTVAQAIADDGYGLDTYELAIIICNPGCKTTWYTYDENGKEIGHVTLQVKPPEVGVALPFPYLLGGGAALGITFVAAGIVVRRRARRRNS